MSLAGPGSNLNPDDIFGPARVLTETGEEGDFLPPEQQQEPPEPPPTEQPPPPEAQPPEQTAAQFAFAGRQYPSQQEAEESYRHLQAHATRMEQERAEYIQRLEQYDQMWQQVEPLLQQVAQGQPPQGQPSADEFASFGEALGLEGEQLQAFQAAVQKMVDARVGPLAQQFQQSATAAQQQEAMRAYETAVQASIAQFRSRHPEVAEGTDQDRALAEFVIGINNRYRDQFPVGVVDARDPDQLELAYEAYRNQALAQEILAQPDLLRTPEGRSVARRRAGIAAPQPGVPAPASGNVRPLRQAHVETGGTGAPVQAAPGPRREEDAFSRIEQLAEQARARRNLFVSRVLES